MTRIGVISDSHGLPANALAEAAQALRAQEVQRLIHLGDGERDGAALAERLGVPLTAVAGNCDEGSRLAREVTLNAGCHRLLLMHGHRACSTLGVLLRAQEVAAGVALFGHTHAPLSEWRDGVLLLNPGALRDGRFAVLSLDADRAEARLLLTGR